MRSSSVVAAAGFALAGLVACGTFIDPSGSDSPTAPPAPTAASDDAAVPDANAAAEGGAPVDREPVDSGPVDGGLVPLDAGECAKEGICGGSDSVETKTCCPGLVCFSPTPGPSSCVACTTTGGSCANNHSAPCCEGLSCNGSVCQ